MIQLIAFLVTQLIFVPVYLAATRTCTGKQPWRYKISLIFISPFSAYLYTNILFGLLSTILNEEKMKHLSSFSDIIIILMSFFFVLLYTKVCMKIDKWNAIYYSSIYLTFFLLQMAFNYTYATIMGAIFCNIFVPVLVIIYYMRKILPLSRLRRIPPSLSVSAGGGMNLLQYDLFL